jgi:phosphoglucosamine mutase
VSERRYFGTDGIRAVANTGNLAPDMVQRIGHAVGKLLSQRKSADGRRPRALCVRDTRISGQMISGILTGTMLAHGVDVFDGGILPTPACAWLTRRGEFDLGIVISASHNPMPDNGIKFFGPDGRKLSDADEFAIENWIDRGEAHDTRCTGADLGRLETYDDGENIYIESFVEELFPKLDLSGFKIVLDCANGAAYRTAPRILSALGAEVTVLNAAPDGTNINDKAGVFHVDDIAPIVRRERADLGFVLDGDADRIMMIDHHGRVCDGDVILAALARAQAPDAKRELVVTVMSNMGLLAVAKELGFRVHQTPVGDRWVAERMEQERVDFGGEQSGHVVFRTEKGWIGDGLYTALRVVDAFGTDRGRLAHLADSMTRFPQVLKNVKVASKPPITELSRFQEALRRHEKALSDEGRILVRYSGTEMLARVMVEGRDQAVIEKIAADLADVLLREIGA